MLQSLAIPSVQYRTKQDKCERLLQIFIAQENPRIIHSLTSIDSDDGAGWLANKTSTAQPFPPLPCSDSALTLYPTKSFSPPALLRRCATPHHTTPNHFLSCFFMPSLRCFPSASFASVFQACLPLPLTASTSYHYRHPSSSYLSSFCLL